MRVGHVLHGFSIVTILSLSVFIIYENTGDRDSHIQSELKFALKSGLDEMIKSNADALNEVVRILSVYPNAINLKYLGLAENVARKTENVLNLLDSLQRHPSVKLAHEAQGQLYKYRKEIAHLINQDSLLDQHISNDGHPASLSNSVQNDGYNTFCNNVEEAKIQVALTEELVLHSIFQLVACDIQIDPYTPFVSHQFINPSTGDTILADVLLTSDEKPHLPIAYYLDDIQLPANKKGIASFQVRYERSGIYPLRVAIIYPNWLTDSTEHFEKTYLLRVRE